IKGNFSQSGSGGTPDPGVAAFLQANPYFQSDPSLAAQAIIDPSKFDPAIVKYINAIPMPVSADSLISSNGASTDDYNQITSRVDFDPTSSDKFTLTMGGQRGARINPFNNASTAGFPDSSTSNSYFGGLGFTHTFSPTVVNEFHFNVQRSNGLQAKPTLSYPNAAALGIGLTPDLPIEPPNFDFSDTGLSLGFSVQGPSNLVGTTWDYADSMTMVRGNHTVTFGGSFSAYEQNMVFDYLGNGDITFCGSCGVGTGNEFADFLLGIPAELDESPDAPSNVRQKQSSLYLQDNWRVSNGLTLSYGLRYSVQQPKHDTRGREFGLLPGVQSQVFPNAPLGLVFPGDPGEPSGSNFTDYDNFAPRFGFAWDPSGSGKTSIRGGAGVFYDVLKAEDNFQFNGQPPFASSVFFSFPTVGAKSPQNGPVGYMEAPFAAVGIANPFPSKPPSSNLNFVTAGFIPYTPQGAVFVDPHIYTPYIYQYNLSIEHQLNRSLVAELNYVGSSSHGLTGSVDENPFALGTNNRVLNVAALAANPGINAACNTFAAANGDNPASTCPYFFMEDFTNVGFATFNSLEASMTKRVSAGQSRYFGNSAFTMAYTLGRSTDNESGFRNNTSTVPAYNHFQFNGPSDFDVTQNFTFAGDWTLPFAQMWNGGPSSLLGGWMLDPIFTWRSGFPLTPGAGLDGSSDPSIPGPSGAGDPFLANAALAAGVNQVQTLDPRLTGNHYFAASDFSNQLTSADPYGAARGLFRGPGLINLDMALVKEIHLTEGSVLQLRGEAFNIFNHANFNNPVLNINSGRFGRITGTAAPRIVQLAAHLSF
ncbi:MAG: TonB-dependent receptor domain-containing protein, partial [Terriglobia bacterium]